MKEIMPIYEYLCTKCGRTTEVMQKFSEPPMSSCSECGGSVNKLISRTSFQLKGSGWYATDYKDKGKAPKKSEEATSDVKKTADTKTAETPATSSTSKGETD